MAQEGSRPTRFEPKACAFCGEMFRAWTPAKKYCSPACRLKAVEARRAARARPAPLQEGGDAAARGD